VSAEAAAAALAGFSGLAPRSLRRLLDVLAPSDAWELAVRGQLGEVVELRQGRAREVAERLSRVDPDAVAASCAASDIDVLVHGTPAYPVALGDDPEAPAVLFARGQPLARIDELRRVAIVGTRSATAAGRATARDLGHDLSASGVAVVSGLAIGVDGAAHRGALDGGGLAVAVLAHGLDRCYPERHRHLFEQMCADHVVLSEWPPGVGPEPWRFPLRNRIIAGLAEVVVVVESRVTGGSLITARAALDRGIDVLVVPGSPQMPASEGTNMLLRDGAGVVTDVDDVLMALGISHDGCRGVAPVRPPGLPGSDASPHGDVVAVLADGPATLDTLAARTMHSVADVACAVSDLVGAGLVVAEGGWVELAMSRLSGQHPS
jgi:DNA processing protein